MWVYAAIVLAVAVVGKLGGCRAARQNRRHMGWRDAVSLGILMNTRGLMQLIILNLGLDVGVISPAVFAMMVVMALLTTFMTAPLLDATYKAPRLMVEAVA